MKKLRKSVCNHKLRTLLKLEASDIKTIIETTEILPDFDLVSYGGLDDRHYPIWLEFDFKDKFVFIHRLILEDFGYDTEHRDEVLYKYTSGSGGGGDQIGEIKMHVQSLDRFACKVYLRGQLHGSSAEMNMDIAFKFSIAGYVSKSDKIGYAAEAIAEGFAFENEGRLKQAFFSYFTAIDSYINAERDKLNRGQPSDKQIPQNDRLNDQLARIMKANLTGRDFGLNDIPFWGDVVTTFKRLEKRRNAIAHNNEDIPITQEDVDNCFTIFVIAVAMNNDLHFSEIDIIENYS